jgi:hypothetical protein
MSYPRWLCSFMPYLYREDLGMSRALRKAGIRAARFDYGIAWGFGHPRTMVNFTDPIEGTTTTCVRCGYLRRLMRGQ